MHLLKTTVHALVSKHSLETTHSGFAPQWNNAVRRIRTGGDSGSAHSHVIGKMSAVVVLQSKEIHPVGPLAELCPGYGNFSSGLLGFRWGPVTMHSIIV